ncbi:hypothetical protein K9M41_03680 [Candidatus Gracilibacteria bacterium]|nr:hypothetical protein [Candidatus Gracilibacteria bacterium]
MTTTKQTKDSFLDETQQEGRASGKVEISDLDQAIANVNVILDDEVVEKFRKTKEEELPTAKMAVYCHDCNKIVPAGIGKTLRGNARTICGICKSKKISMGIDTALKKFYRLDDNGKREENSKKKEK